MNRHRSEAIAARVRAHPLRPFTDLELLQLRKSTRRSIRRLGVVSARQMRRARKRAWLAFKANPRGNK